MIQINDLQIRYDDFIAMDNLDLHIKEGEFFTLLGPSGCGKTSILRAITGFIEPYKGSIKLDGKTVTHMPVEERDVGIVFQSYALFPTMNVFENIAFGLRVGKYKNKEIKELVHDIAKKVDLNTQQLNRNASELSGGQQQRVAIARALVMKPKILCLDEPLSNLDAKLRHQLRLELKDLQKKFGITTVYVTHDQEEALTLSDRIAVFNNGKLEQVDTPSGVYYNSGTEFVSNFLGAINQLPAKILGEDESTLLFVRLNDVKSQNDTSIDTLSLQATVLDTSFYGLYTIVEYKTDYGFEIKNVVINNNYKAGDKVNLYIDKSKITQVKGK